MKLNQILSESIKPRSLLGMKIDGKVITDQTKNEDWSGHFSCSGNKLTSLEHAPQSVGGNFYCYNNNLTSLEHAPQSVGYGFNCSENNLTSLEHAPRSIGGHFYCSGNNLTLLEHTPQSIGGSFSCTDNNITSLHNIHKHLQQMKGPFYCYNNPITRQILGVLLIKGCTGFSFRNDVDKIINKYLPNTHGMVAVNACQDELIEAGLEDFAEL